MKRLLQARRTLVCRAFGHQQCRVIESIEPATGGQWLILATRFQCLRCHTRRLPEPRYPAFPPYRFIVALLVAHGTVCGLAALLLPGIGGLAWWTVTGISTAVVCLGILFTPHSRGTRP